MAKAKYWMVEFCHCNDGWVFEDDVESGNMHNHEDGCGSAEIIEHQIFFDRDLAVKAVETALIPGKKKRREIHFADIYSYDADGKSCDQKRCYAKPEEKIVPKWT